MGAYIMDLLKACTKQKDLLKGTELHADILRKGLFEKDWYLGSAVVNMYAKCGALAKSAAVLDELPVRGIVVWNALVSGYVQQGCREEVLKYFEIMQMEGLSPDSFTFTCLLKACASIELAHKGEQIHEEIIKQRLLEKDLVLGTALVDMYAKCGALVKAEEVLLDLPVRDVICWNALMAGYIQHGQSREALKCHKQMQAEGLCPNAVTFICILKACASIKAIDQGEQAHKKTIAQGLLEENTVLGGALVDMYAKCGALEKAVEVLDALLARDRVCWSALIEGYTLIGQGDAAWKCFEQMQQEGLTPNAITFLSILKACGCVGALQKGEHVHDVIVRQGLLANNLVLGNAVVDMYAKCNALTKAAKVFDGLPFRNEVSWSALITGYTQHGQGEQALKCFKQMEYESLSPDTVTFLSILKACSSIGAGDKGEQIHRDILRKRLMGKDIMLGNTLVDMYVKSGAFDKAVKVLNELPSRNAVSWNSLIVGYVEQGMSERALECFEQMQCENIFPNIVSCIYILKACGNIGASDKADQIYSNFVREGLLQIDPVLGKALVRMYSKFGSLQKAEEVFDELPYRDRDSWNALIAGYAQVANAKAALNYLQQMQWEGVSPDPVTYACMLKTCGSIWAAKKGEQIHNDIIRQGLLQNDVLLGSALVDMYARCGELEKASQVLDTLNARDVVIWSALISAYVQKGQGEEALKCFERMQQEGIHLNAVDFTCMLAA